MVTRSFTQGLSWLHARVRRQIPVARLPERNLREINSRVRVKPSTTAALQPTVYLPLASDKKLVA